MVDCSIIIPVLNQEFLTKQCLDTLLGPARDRALLLFGFAGALRRHVDAGQAVAPVRKELRDAIAQDAHDREVAVAAHQV